MNKEQIDSEVIVEENDEQLQINEAFIRLVGYEAFMGYTIRAGLLE